MMEIKIKLFVKKPIKKDTENKQCADDLEPSKDTLYTIQYLLHIDNL